MSLRGEHGPHPRPARALRRLIAGVCGAALIIPASALAGSSPSSAPGAPCAGSGASAQNQYCENIPSAGGSQTPGSGSPTLGSTLPAPARARLFTGASPGGGSSTSTSTSATPKATAKHSRARKRATVNAVLNLPAAPRWSLGTAPPGSASVSVITPFTWLIVLLAALGLGAGVIGGLRHRRTPST